MKNFVITIARQYGTALTLSTGAKLLTKAIKTGIMRQL